MDAQKNAAKRDDGKVQDPLTSKAMGKGEPWDMGHKPGFEYRKHRDSAYQRGISRDQFLDEHNDPSHYWPELPERGDFASRAYGGKTVAWLQGVPISEAETAYLREHGADALFELFERHDPDFVDLQCASVV